MNTQQSATVRDIELNIEEAKKLIGIRDSLVRLESNPDFKKVILEGYFKDEAVRLVHLKCAPQMQKPDMQADILKSIDGIGSLHEYFRKIDYVANMAEKAVDEGQEAINEIEFEAGSVH